MTQGTGKTVRYEEERMWCAEGNTDTEGNFPYITEQSAIEGDRVATL